MYIQANINALKGLSYSMFSQTSGGKTRMAFKVIEFGGVGYSPYSKELEQKIDFDYIVVDEIPWEKDWFFLGGFQYLKDDIKKEFTFHSKVVRNLNTAIDVYFTFRGKVYGVRFTDWNLLNVLSDAQCVEKLNEYITAHNQIQNPAKPLA